MKREFARLITIGFLLLVAMPAISANMDHPNMEGMKHEGMDHGVKMDEGMVMLGDKTESGVKAMAHLQDVKDKMAKMGMSETHHFMVIFTNAKSGETIDAGAVAIKTKSPSGEESAPLKLMGMQGHFGADVTLKEKGEYHFLIGTRLEDGQKRQYDFQYTLK